MTAKAERNKALVLEAMTSLFQQKDPLAVGRLYLPGYIQHNPGIPQGSEALAKLVAQLPSAVHYEPGLVIAEGDYVAIHGRIRGWAPKVQVVVDIFRIEDGKIAEHWDVLQDEISGDAAHSGIAMFAADEAARQSAAAKADAQVRIDYDARMQANLSRVFGEPDAGRRIEAISELYVENAVLHEPQDSVTGHAAISEAVSHLLGSLPQGMAFEPVGPAVGHNNVGRLKWRSGPAHGPIVITGTDVAVFEDGRIAALYVFLDPPGA